MHEQKHSPHSRLQRRVLIGTIVLAIVGSAIAIPLIVNDDLRYNLAMRFGQIPGQNVEKIADGDDGALLIVLPLDHAGPSDITPWLFRAQFIAWPHEEGIELENLDTGDHLVIPVSRIEFISANGDGTLIFLRGERASSSELVAIVVHVESMSTEELASPDMFPDAPGDWETSIWDKQVSWCHRPSPGMRFIACFVPSDLASYAAGDWELTIQFWGDYHHQYPIFRGQGLLPFVGFTGNDSVMYFQNERGLWRAEIPENLLVDAPPATPYATPRP